MAISLFQWNKVVKIGGSREKWSSSSLIVIRYSDRELGSDY